jgi:hypothetical protein
LMRRHGLTQLVSTRLAAEIDAWGSAARFAQIKQVAPNATCPPESAVLLVYNRPGEWNDGFNGYYQVEGEHGTRGAKYRPTDQVKRERNQGKMGIATMRGHVWYFYGSTGFAYHTGGNAQSAQPPIDGWHRYGPGGGDATNQPRLLWLE